jgi:hypothetical protein
MRGRSVVYNCCWSSPAQSFSGPSPARLMIYFTVSNSRLFQPGGPGPPIYIPQEQGDPVTRIPPGAGFSFRRVLRLSGLRWRYSTPPPHGWLISYFPFAIYYLMQHGPHGKHRVQHFFYCCVCIRYCGNVFTELLLSKARGKTHRQQGYRISLLLFIFFQNKRSWIKGGLQIGRRHVEKNPWPTGHPH